MIALSCGGTEERGRGFYMIDVTKLNDSVITINSDLIETVEETPDTVLSYNVEFIYNIHNFTCIYALTIIIRWCKLWILQQL